MSFIIRIAVLCLLLAAIPCITAAADSGDHDYGHDTGVASGSDNSAGDSLARSETGGHNEDSSSAVSSWSPSSEGGDGSGDRGSTEDTSRGSGTIPAISESGTDNKVSSGSGSTYNTPAKDRTRDSREPLDSDEKTSAREMHNEESEEDLAGSREPRVGDQESTDTHSVYDGVVRALPDNNEETPGDPDVDRLSAMEKTLPDDSRAATGSRSGLPLPGQFPNGDVPFASIPSLPASGLPISSATGSADGSRPITRNKNKDEHKPFWKPTDSTFILSPFMLIKLWCFLGFRRVLRKNVLESDERRSLYESITDHPGVDLSNLTEMLRLNKETARYHLKMLAANGKISGLIKQGIARYFPCREMISEFEKTVIHYLWIGTTKRILQLLIETPGLTRQAIARELGIAGPSVTWQMQRLAEDGLIEMRTEGRFVRYFLTPGSVGALESVKKSDGRTGQGFL